ncbi:MAG: hypothetical protein M3Y37_07345 [Chloroflexota bacterium]|nr:hypothetical protein [Chloroflexota bacterium]
MNRRSLLSSAAFLSAGFGSQASRAQSASALVWSEIPAVGPSPAPRYDHSLSAAGGERALVLFGGRDANGSPLGDTWIFRRSSNEWVAVTGDGPSPRFGHAVAADSEGDVIWLFGGQAGETFHNDLWAFDARERSWTLVEYGSGNAPAPRYGTSLVRTDTGELILSHGFTFSGRFNDTWIWTADAGWTDISPEDGSERPLNRCLHESVWDENNGAMLLYGGCSSGYGPCPQGDLWRFDPAARAWSLLDPQAAPEGRMNPALVYDGGRGQTMLIGGLTDTGYDSGCWSLTDASSPSWTPVEASGGPSARASHDACVTGPHLYLFGGTGDSGVTGDLWTTRLDGR